MFVRFIPDFFRSFFYPLCVILWILFVANERSFGFPTGVTGLFVIGSGKLPLLLTYVAKYGLTSEE